MFTEDKVTEIFFMADEFCKFFYRLVEKYSVGDVSHCRKRKYYRAPSLSPAEVMTILIMFHASGYRCLKHFYLQQVCLHQRFLAEIYGRLVGDKGYISRKLFEHLFVDGIQLITKLKNNMKGALMSIADRVLLRKRALIETINDKLKNMAQVEHSRHRAFHGFFVNLMAGLAAYCFFPKKPSINLQFEHESQLVLF